MTSATTGAAGLAYDPHRTRRAVAVGIGNFMEWFDFSIYGFFAVAIGANFFPAGSASTQLLSALAVYGVAFLFRPLGGLVVGSLGDRFGRRFALSLSIIVMGVATFLIAVLPNEATAGVIAPILLVFLRAVQGFSAGGEWTGSAGFLIESAPKGHRSRTAAIVPMTAAIAVVVGALVAILIESTVPADSIVTWGWRIPFLAALPLALIGLYLRLKLEDTLVFTEMKSEGKVEAAPIRRMFRKNLRSVGIAFALAAVTVLGYYYLATYVPTFLTTVAGLPRIEALTLVAIGVAIYAALCPVAGIVADKIGRKPVSLVGSIGLAVFAIPAFLLMATGNAFLAILGIAIFGLFEACHNVTSTTMLIELFPPETRATGSAVGYNLGSALIAGPGPLIAAAIATAGIGAGAPAYYIVAVAIVVTVVVWRFLPETSGRELGTDVKDPWATAKDAKLAKAGVR